MTDDPKASLRAQLRARRADLRHAQPDAALRAAAAFAEAGLGPFATVAVYHPRGSEMDSFPLVALLRRLGVQVALPVVVEKDAPLVFRLVQEDGPLPPDALGIPSPGEDAPAVRPDAVFVPLLAFDRRGGRLGQGGGYYDRTLEALRAAGPVTAIGLAYAGQELAEVPTSPHDQRLDGVLTERGYLAVDRDDR